MALLEDAQQLLADVAQGHTYRAVPGFRFAWLHRPRVRPVSATVAAHIHQGAADAIVVVVDFDWENNPGADCVTADPAVVSEILANPSGYYVNVHTPEFSAGAIRGQLVVAVGGTPAGALVGAASCP